jgi:hypothetical protein
MVISFLVPPQNPLESGKISFPVGFPVSIRVKLKERTKIVTYLVDYFLLIIIVATRFSGGSF